MQEIQEARARTTLPVARMTTRARIVTGAALILSAVGVNAGAEGVEALTTAATTGASGLGAAVLTIAGVAVTIGLGWWAASKLRPKA